MNQKTFFSSIKESIDYYKENLISLSLRNTDNDLDSEMFLHPNSETSNEIRDIAYEIANEVLMILDEAGIFYRVIPQTENFNEQLNQLMKAKSYQNLIDGILWIFSPVNGKALPERVLDGSMLTLIQSIENYLISISNLEDLVLFSNPYQVHLNFLKNKFGGDSRVDESFELLGELVTKQKPQKVQISNNYMECPECQIRLGFHDLVCPKYCHNCGKRLKT